MIQGIKSNKFAGYAWSVLAYTLAVILWGAYVRATSSGAGCGSHWPTCNGQVIPRPEQIETLIEFTHRITSAFLGVLIIGLLVWAFRLYAKGHRVRRGAVLSFIFVITEGLIGAGLVLFEWVGTDESVARTVSIALHLINTLFLVAFITLTAWWASGGRPLRRPQGTAVWLLGAGIVGLLLVGASGAVTALGDTLFPARSLAEGVRQDLSPTAHLLIRLRVWHPILAIIVGLYVVLTGTAVFTQHPSPPTRFFSRAVKAIVVFQLVAGALNVYLLAPVWMQLVHLLLADLTWIAWILLGATALAETAARPQTTQRATQKDRDLRLETSRLSEKSILPLNRTQIHADKR